MSSIVDFNNNKSSLTDGKYHLLLVYLVHDGGHYYGGGFYEPSLKMTGAFGGDSIKEMVDDAYELLEDGMKDEKNIPFDIKNIKDSVVFDLVECRNVNEMETALEYQDQGISYEKLKQIISE